MMLEENQSTQIPELSGNTSKQAEASSDVPQTSAEFRTMPQDAEEFGNVPQVAERKENHTLTVRETARMFEAAGVARTERSIINWCQPNRQGITRLDCYFDPNERKYFLTPQSVEAAIQEELQRSKTSTNVPDSEKFRIAVAHVKHPDNIANLTDARKIQELKWEILDLKITNRGKEYLIGELIKERKSFLDQLLAANRTVGQLETKLNQLSGP
ncbi:MAG: hypothetical protein WCK57_07895 [Verrucomicrobiae bacterium]